MGIVCFYPRVILPLTGKSTRLFFVESFLHYRPQTDSQVKETGLAPHGDALTIALNERVRGEDDVGIPQEKSHSLSDGGGAIDGVVIGVRDADPAPSVHAEQFLSLRQFCSLLVQVAGSSNVSSETSRSSFRP